MRRNNTPTSSGPALRHQTTNAEPRRVPERNRGTIMGRREKTVSLVFSESGEKSVKQPDEGGSPWRGMRILIETDYHC